MANAQLSSYENSTYRAGVNLRACRLDISDSNATELTNFVITIDGIRRKRREPLLRTTLKNSPSGYVNGMAAFLDSSDIQHVMAALDGKLYSWLGGNDTPSEITPYLPDGTTPYSLSSTNKVRFAAAYSNLYVVDGSSYLSRYDGTKLQAVMGTAQNLPIVPTTVVFTNGNSSLDVTDPAGDGKLYQSGVQVGTIAYDTGIYIFSPTFPWSTGSVTVTYDKPTVQPTETFFRVAQDGSLQYPALLNSTIKPGSLVLTDQHAISVTSNETQHGSYPTGWFQLLDSGNSVVGAYNPTLGKFAVDTAAFTAGDTVSAAYVYGQNTVTEATPANSFQKFNDGGNLNYYVLEWNLTHGTHGVIAGSITWPLTLTPGGTVTRDPNTSGGDTEYLWDGTTDMAVVTLSTGDVSSEGGNIGMPDGSENPDITYLYWANAVSGEAVGTADASGKLYQFATSQQGLAAVAVTITQSTNVVTGIPGGNLYKGASNVGTISADGVVAVTSSSVFTAASSPVITYYLPSSVGSTAITFGNKAGAIGGLTPFGGQDILWWNNRLWITGTNSLSFSDAYAPETFSQPSLSVSATGTLKLLGYSYNRLYLFNVDAGANGEIFYVDVSDADITNWKAISVYSNMSLVGSDCIIRAAKNDGSDIIFNTIDGIRTIRTTIQDAVSGPSLPFDFNVIPWRDTFNNNAMFNAWAIVFDDELMIWNPKAGNSAPSLVSAYDMKIIRETQQDGWTQINMPSSSGVTGIEAFCGCIADFGQGKQLFIGSASGGLIVQMFGAATTASNFMARSVSKGITFDSKFSSYAPRKVIERIDPGSVGTYTIKIADDQDNEYTLGSKTIETSGIKNWIHSFDATYPYGSTTRIPPSKDWRVIEETNNDIAFGGFQIIASPFKPRFVQLDEANTSGAATDTPITDTLIADTAIF